MEIYMIIPDIASEPVFLRDMYDSLSETLELEEKSFSLCDFVQNYLEVQNAQDQTVKTFASILVDKVLTVDPQFTGPLKDLLMSVEKLSQAPNALLNFAESLRRRGVPEEDVDCLQKYAFQFAFLSLWNPSEDVSSRAFIESGLNQFETLRSYRKDLSKILQIRADDIVKLMEKVFPKHASSQELQSLAAEIQKKIQRFFNQNLYKAEAAEAFSIVEGSQFVIDARIQNKVGEIMCYRRGNPSAIASHLLLPVDGADPIVNVSKVNTAQAFPVEEFEKRKIVSEIPEIQELLVPAPSVYTIHSGFLLRSPGDWETLYDQIHADPLAFSGREWIEISQQILQSLKTLAQHQYMYHSLKPERIAVRKTEAGVETRLNDLESLVRFSDRENEPSLSSASYVFNKKKMEVVKEVILNKFFAFLARNFLGIHNLHENWEPQLFEQIESMLDPQEYEEILWLRKYSHGNVESYVRSLQNYVKKLQRDSSDLYSIATIKQFIERFIVYTYLQPLSLYLSSHDDSQSLSWEDVIENLNQAKRHIEEVFAEKEKIERLHVSKNYISQYVHLIENQKDLDVFYEILSDFLQNHREIGSDLRFHKGDLWNEEEIPFSFRLQTVKNKVVLTLFPPYTDDRSYFIAKPAWQMEILPYGSTALYPIEVIRDSRYEFVKERRKVMFRARNILKVPGALRYFAYAPSQQLSYVGSKKCKKWEMYSERYKESLTELSIEDRMDVLYHLLQGVKLIARKGLVHGEIFPENVGVYRVDEGEVRARFLWKTCPLIINPLHYDSLRKQSGKLTLESDVYAFVRLLAYTLLPDLNVISWESESLEEIKAALYNKRKERMEDPGIAIEGQIEDFILPLLKQSELADCGIGISPTLQEVEDVLLNCYRVFEEPFPYLNPYL
jgi:hypothetical protein